MRRSIGGETAGRPTTLGADDGIRTRDPHLGKVVLYQLSHVRVTTDFITGRRPVRIPWTRTPRRPACSRAARPPTRAPRRGPRRPRVARPDPPSGSAPAPTGPGSPPRT